MNNRFFESYYTVIKQNAENSRYLKKKIDSTKKSIKTRIILASYLWISTVKEQTS